jgi:hypothetical protein
VSELVAVSQLTGLGDARLYSRHWLASETSPRPAEGSGFAPLFSPPFRFIMLVPADMVMYQLLVEWPRPPFTEVINNHRRKFTGYLVLRRLAFDCTLGCDKEIQLWPTHSATI